MNLPGQFNSSVNTRLNFQSAQTPAYPGVSQYPPFVAPFMSTFALDPSNPFFRVITGATAGNNSFPAAWTFATQFVFTLGGVNASSTPWLTWGGANYDGTPSTNGPLSGLSANLMLGFEVDLYNVHSQYTGTCVLVGADGNNEQGVATRWTALADKVVATTYPVVTAAYTTLVNKLEFFHGVIQQPW